MQASGSFFFNHVEPGAVEHIDFRSGLIIREAGVRVRLVAFTKLILGVHTGATGTAGSALQIRGRVSWAWGLKVGLYSGVGSGHGVAYASRCSICSLDVLGGIHHRVPRDCSRVQQRVGIQVVALDGAVLQPDEEDAFGIPRGVQGHAGEGGLAVNPLHCLA